MCYISAFRDAILFERFECACVCVSFKLNFESTHNFLNIFASSEENMGIMISCVKHTSGMNAAQCETRDAVANTANLTNRSNFIGLNKIYLLKYFEISISSGMHLPIQKKIIRTATKSDKRGRLNNIVRMDGQEIWLVQNQSICGVNKYILLILTHI